MTIENPVFRLEVELSNDAFGGEAGPEELARILRRVASHVECQGTGELANDGEPVFDVNGNHAGQWTISFEEAR